MYDIVTIGDSTIDMFLEIDEATLNCDVKTAECQLCFTYADKIPIAGAHQSIGGNAANVAVGAQKLGLKAAIMTEVGDDLNGMVIREELHKNDVDTRYLRLITGKETRYAVVLNYKSERTILSYHAERSYRVPKIPKTHSIYFTSLGKTFERVQKSVIAYKKKHPETILACNPGSYQCGKGLHKTRELLKFTDILFVNKQEAQTLTNTKAEIPELVSLLHGKGVKTVVVTDGSHGSYVSEGSGVYMMPRFPVRTVSRTGAGDAYASGFLAAQLNGHPLPVAMRWGTANAAAVVQQFGGQAGLLTQKKISSSLKKFAQFEAKIIS